jgi:hypothetical protein
MEVLQKGFANRSPILSRALLLIRGTGELCGSSRDPKPFVEPHGMVYAMRWFMRAFMRAFSVSSYSWALSGQSGGIRRYFARVFLPHRFT